ncbi:hypothetical protein COA01_15470 [Bacillus cereus]|uniref:hypothetical protein n=1 Tax=Bacillus cereus TaxID=1396 RepID=UPI000BFB7135|nr:hypothetical protein [Bacillus cereus]PGP20937.1 hypothetical protein COA01_15470 [Bacillus cereus]
MTKGLKFKKVSDIQTHISQKLGTYSMEQDFNNQDFVIDDAYFTVKKAELYLKASNEKRRYISRTALFSAEIDEKDSENLYIRVDIKPTTEWSSSNKPTDEQLASVLSILCSYWLEYTEFKDSKRVLFRWSNYRESLDVSIFKKAMELLQYRELLNASEIISINGHKSNNLIVFRSNEADEKLDIAECMQEYIEKSKMKSPSFTVEKFGTGLIATFTTTYYYENDLFSIDWEKKDDQNVLVLKREERENQYFPLTEGVVEDILSSVSEEMKLSNLLKPPVKHLKEFCKEHLEFEPEEALLEEKIRFVDEKIGVGETENELFRILQMIKQHRPEYSQYGSSRHVTKKPINNYALDRESKKSFEEIYSDEFKIWSFKTNEYFWHVMYSQDEGNMWLYPEKTEGLPKALKEDVESIFEERRDPDLVEKIEQIIESMNYIQSNKNLKTNSYGFRTSLSSYNNIAKDEFGKQWWNERQSKLQK